MLHTVFWLSLFLLLYVYVGYPILVRCFSALFPASVRRDDTFRPSVSIVIAAYNEAADIAETLDNKLAQDYPTDLMEVLVVSDESDDGTDEIVSEKAETSRYPIKLIRQTPRQGKTAGLNLLIPHAKGDILMFSDANSLWGRQTVARLARNFSDPNVGYVTGKMVYVNNEGSLVGDGCSAYMKYENWLREFESRLGSIVGVDGGIDAMRKSLHTQLRPDQLPDFVQPLKVIEQGYRVVYEPEAVLKEKTNQDSASEFSMRVRVGVRSLRALKDMAQLMNPFRYGIFSWQIISHKLLRYLAFIPLITFSVATMLLAARGGFYMMCFLGLVVFYGLAWAGRKNESEGRSLTVFHAVPYYFLLLNIASFRALWGVIEGEKKVVWNPRKG